MIYDKNKKKLKFGDFVVWSPKAHRSCNNISIVYGVDKDSFNLKCRSFAYFYDNNMIDKQIIYRIENVFRTYNLEQGRFKFFDIQNLRNLKHVNFILDYEMEKLYKKTKIASCYKDLFEDIRGKIHSNLYRKELIKYHILRNYKKSPYDLDILMNYLDEHMEE